jgi:hypothetical protein
VFGLLVWEPLSCGVSCGAFAVFFLVLCRLFCFLRACVLLALLSGTSFAPKFGVLIQFSD